MMPSSQQINELKASLLKFHGNRFAVIEEKATKMTKYLDTLNGFQLFEFDVPTPHAGRVIVDGVLQQGKDFEKLVRPAVKSILKFNEATTLSGFIDLLITRPLNEILIKFTKENTKIDLLNTAKYFTSKGLDTYTSLQDWLLPEENRDMFRMAGKLGPFFRVADKSADYFRKLVGHWDAIAVDRGQKQLLANAGLVPFYSTATIYKEKRAILQMTAIEIKCRPIDLDESIYQYYVRTNKMKERQGSFQNHGRELIKYCYNCGQQLMISDKFCIRCGNKQRRY